MARASNSAFARTLLACMLGALCLASAQAAEPVFPPGSRIGLTPPAGFLPSAHFHGFENPDRNASILTLEMPAGAYAAIEKAMTAAALKNQGVTVERRETLPLKAGKGLLIVGRQEADGTRLRKWILIASASDTTAMLTVQIPEDSKTAYPDSAIRAALASLTIRAVVPLDEQIGLLPFKMDDLAGLRPFRVVRSSAVFLTKGPNDTTEPAEQPLLMISVSSGGPERPGDRNEFARELLSGLSGFRDLHVVGTDLLRLNAMQTHEIMAEAKDYRSGTDLKLVQWLRFGSGGFVRLVGVASARAWPDAFPRFRAVRDGVTPR